MRGDAREFAAALALGNLGERLVADFARSRGSGVIPSYDYSGKNGEKAPRLMFSGGGFVIPDLDLCRDGRRWWLEVKTYQGPVENYRRRCAVHGFPDRLFRDYLTVEQKSGCPVHIAILEMGSGCLLVAQLSRLEPVSFGCQCRGCEGRALGGWCAAPIRKGRYWPRSAMREVHRFGEAELAPLRAAAEARRECRPTVMRAAS